MGHHNSSAGSVSAMRLSVAPEWLTPEIQGDGSSALKKELALDVLRTSGRLRLRVHGSSMLPSLWPGDILELAPLNGEAPKMGEIILHQWGQNWYIHRVIAGNGSESERVVVTQGDSLPAPDPPAPLSQVLGRVVRIERGARRFHPAPQLRGWRRTVALLARRWSFVARWMVRLRRQIST